MAHKTHASSAGAVAQITSGTLGNRPAPGNVDTYYLVIPTGFLYYDNGIAWEIVSPVGAQYDVIWGIFTKGDHSDLNPVVNNIYATPIMVRYPMTISHLCLPIRSTSSGNVKAAIYDDDGAVPGASPGGASRLAVTASEAASAIWTRMDMALTAPLIVTEPGLKWLAVKADDATLGLDHGLADWSEAAGPTTPAWAPNNYIVDPGGVYANAMPDPFPAAPTIDRAVAMGILVQSVP